MKQLNYAALKEAGYKGFLQENAPEKVLQFGEGNFLRAFVDYWFDISNEKAGGIFNGRSLGGNFVQIGIEYKATGDQNQGQQKDANAEKNALQSFLHDKTSQ